MKKKASKKRKSNSSLSQSLRKREHDALVRRHRQVVFLNDREKALVEEYCRRNKEKSKSALIRKIVVERHLTELGQNPPTLF